MIDGPKKKKWEPEKKRVTKKEKKQSFGWNFCQLYLYWYLKRPKYLIKYDLLNLVTLQKRY